ncbi:MAG: hypothetical protein ACP5N3_02220 [Candidatus Nanoarchaeia archaeon]
MGLFGLGKKKDSGKDFDLGGMGGIPENTPQSFNSGYNDPMMDPNSGLKLNDLNSQGQDAGFGQQTGMDSFGNPKPQPRGEYFESKSQAYTPPQESSKDMQLVLAKLDTIRTELTNIHHRLDNIEKQQEQPQKKYPW